MVTSKPFECARSLPCSPLTYSTYSTYAWFFSVINVVNKQLLEFWKCINGVIEKPIFPSMSGMKANGSHISKLPSQNYSSALEVVLSYYGWDGCSCTQWCDALFLTLQYCPDISVKKRKTCQMSILSEVAGLDQKWRTEKTGGPEHRWQHGFRKGLNHVQAQLGVRELQPVTRPETQELGPGQGRPNTHTHNMHIYTSVTHSCAKLLFPS